MRQTLLLVWMVLFFSEPCYAHGFAVSGWLHPLTGVDHMLAMIAVGAWSAQLGGRAIFLVPAAFLCAMLIGGILGFEHLTMVGSERGITFSVLILGLAIALERKITLLLAATGVGLFGVCHGYAHGYEMPSVENQWSYAVGFLITTAGLHIMGAAGGLLMLEDQHGRRWLCLTGVAIAIVGVYLSFKKT